MTDLGFPRAELTSFTQLVQELIGGDVRRHTFTERELQLLLDMQTCRIRKSARADVLRRFLKAVQFSVQNGQANLPRLLEFLDKKRRVDVALAVPAPQAASRSAAGLSSN